MGPAEPAPQPSDAPGVAVPVQETPIDPPWHPVTAVSGAQLPVAATPPQQYERVPLVVPAIAAPQLSAAAGTAEPVHV